MLIATRNYNIFYDYFLNLVSHAKNPLSYYAIRLHETIEQDKPAFCAMVVERSEVIRYF